MKKYFIIFMFCLISSYLYSQTMQGNSNDTYKIQFINFAIKSIKGTPVQCVVVKNLSQDNLKIIINLDDLYVQSETTDIKPGGKEIYVMLKTDSGFPLPPTENLRADQLRIVVFK